jgi:shikimate dehydrogenase
MAPSDRIHLAGVMGWPVKHSRSPKLHNHWLVRYGLAGEYLPLAVEPAALERELRALPGRKFSGVNLTIPHKEAAMALVDRIDDIARKVGAINTVKVEADGSLSATNTDVFGYVASVEEADPSWRADTGPVVVLGAGGAARAVVVGLIEKGAKDIRLTNRTAQRADDLAREFGVAVESVAWSARADALADAAMLVNTTSQGMVGQPPLDIDLGKLPKTALVSDAVYVPLETSLLAAARARGNRTVDGLGMLLHQARPAFQAWFGIMPEVTPQLRAEIEATIE